MLGNADADQLGSIPFSIRTNNINTEWNGIGNRSNFFIRPINRGHQILTFICLHLSMGLVGRAMLVTKFISGNVYVNKSKAWMIKFSMQKQAG